MILIVGAGLAGAVYARELAEAGYRVHVIDKRSHIAGNCFDYVDENGIRIHRYGPHIFHTSNDRVVEWLSRFTEWLPYEHRVKAKLADGRSVPNPVNLNTINAFFGIDLSSSSDVADFLREKSLKIESIVTAEDFLFSTIGKELTDTFFRPYTRKMWEMDLSELDAAVVQRVKVRSDAEERYFPSDTFQAMPAAGYTAMFERIFDHENIRISLDTKFHQEMVRGYDYCFNSMPIDEYFDFALGHLPYRSIRFHLSKQNLSQSPDVATVNYTDETPFTRETWWHKFPGQEAGASGVCVKTVEEPCDYNDNKMERYYPIKTADGRYDALYGQYLKMAQAGKRMSFIGRCGTYQYLDMHQVVNQSLMQSQKWLTDRDQNALDAQEM